MNNKKQIKLTSRSDLFNDNESSDSCQELDEVGQNQLDQLMKMSLFQADDDVDEEVVDSIEENDTEQVENETEQTEDEPEVEKDEESSKMTFRLFSNLPAQVISTKTQEVINPNQKKTMEDYTYKPTDEDRERFNQVSINYNEIIKGSLEKWETKQYPKRLISINLKQVNTQITKKSKNNYGKQKIDYNLSSPYLAKKLFKPEFKGKKVDRVHLRF